MPTRRCVVCRKEADRGRLLRVVWSEEERLDGECRPGTLKLDLAGTAPGRGAYIHLQMGCLMRRGGAESAVASLARYDKKQIERRMALLGGRTIEQLLRDACRERNRAERGHPVDEILREVERLMGQEVGGVKPPGPAAKKRRVLL